MVSRAHVERPEEAKRLDRLVEKARRNLLKSESPRRGFSAEQIRSLAERYSHFEGARDEDGFLTYSEHVVTKLNTPRPYLHLMSANHDEEINMYGAFWDQTGLGFSCLDSVLAGAVTSHKDTSYVPTAPLPSDFRAFYIRDETGSKADIWFMNPQVGRDERRYTHFRCVQGLGFVTIEAERNKIRSAFRTYVPVDETVEIWSVTLFNKSRKQRKLKLFVKLNWGLMIHPAYYFDPRSTSGADVLAELNALIGQQHYKRNALPRTGLMMSDVAFDGFDLSGEAFSGDGHFRYWPEAVEEGNCTNSSGLQPRLGLIGAIQFNITLRPGQSKTVNILVGNTKRQRRDYVRDVKRLGKKFFVGDGVAKQFDRVGRSYERMLARACVDCPDEEVNRAYNVWLKYQAKNTARWIRALDQVGYRDILQDLMGICNFDPGLVRNHLPTVLNYQLRDGRAIRQFFKYPDTDAPNDERMYSDSPLWIADTLVSYVEETGDLAILDKKVGFYDLETHARDESVKKTVYEHCKLGIVSCFGRRGQKGLCLIGYGDWNDPMNGLSKRGKGVSGWLSMALVFAAQRFLRLAEFIGDKKTAAEMTSMVRTMTGNINRGAWDGDHYVFGYNDDGQVAGSQKNAEGRVHCAVNAWALLSGVAASAGREKHLMKVMERLDSPLGYHALDIGYTPKSRDLVGRICDKAPGLSENGSIYTHGHAFYMRGLIAAGMGDRAFYELKKTMPDNTFADISTGPPHQQSNYTVGKFHRHYGQNYFSNFTGSCPWYLKCFDHIFGVLADFDGVQIRPCAPERWKEYRYRKIHLGRTYLVRFRNISGQCRVSRVVANGTEIRGVRGKYKLFAKSYSQGATVGVDVEM